jgi:hypothetical protein
MARDIEKLSSELLVEGVILRELDYLKVTLRTNSVNLHSDSKIVRDSYNLGMIAFQIDCFNLSHAE